MKLSSKRVTLAPLVLAAAALFSAISASALPVAANNKYGDCQKEYDTCKALGRVDCRTKYKACVAKKASAATTAVGAAAPVVIFSVRR